MSRSFVGTPRGLLAAVLAIAASKMDGTPASAGRGKVVDDFKIDTYKPMDPLDGPPPGAKSFSSKKLPKHQLKMQHKFRNHKAGRGR